MRFITDSAPSASKDYGFKPGAGGEYQYDFNGNIILDPHKDMDVVYNYLNLPEWIEFEDCQTIEFTYDAAPLLVQLCQRFFQASLPAVCPLHTAFIIG